MSIAQSIPLASALLLIRFLAGEAQYQRARSSGGIVHFPLGLAMRATMGLGGPFVLYLTYQLTLLAQTTGEWWLPVGSACFAVLTIVAQPAALQADARGIEEIGFLGRRRKIIPWTGAAASYLPVRREVTVIGQDGTEIRHTSYHVGQTEFLSLLKQHHVFVQ